MILLILTFVAGFLTVLAPCVLPLLPVIVGGSFRGALDKRRPYIIAGSLAGSIVLFTLLLKASTVLIGIDPKVWSYISGVLIVLLGATMLYPKLWEEVIGKLGLQSKAQVFLGSANRQKRAITSAVLTGIALGPVFSSCSPTYAWVLATVLPKSFLLGLLYLITYSVGLVAALLLVALLGRKLLSRITWASDPKGLFQRAIAILFILVGLSLITGIDKRVQTWLVDKDYLQLIQLEQKLVPNDSVEDDENMTQVLGVAQTTSKTISFGLNDMVNFVKDPTIIPSGKWSVSGSWTQDEDGIISTGSDAVLYTKLSGTKLAIVARSVEQNSFNEIEVTIDGKVQPSIQISRRGTYTLTDSRVYATDTPITLHVPSGLSVEHLTFED